MKPGSLEAARVLLEELGAPARLLQHVALVGEAGDQLVAALRRLRVPLDADLVRIGIVLHDAGKVVVPAELDAPGCEHEPAGEALLMKNGVTPEVARICLSHARWSSMTVSVEELVVALADKLWKGVRVAELEQRVIKAIAAALGRAEWELFVELDTIFEEIAADGPARLERSRA